MKIIIFKKGFTLVETMVAIFLMTIFFGAVYLIYNASIGSYKSSTNRAESVVASYILYNQLTYDLKSIVCNQSIKPEVSSEAGGSNNVLEFLKLDSESDAENKPKATSIRYVFNPTERTVKRNDQLVSQGKFEKVEFSVELAEQDALPQENNVHFKITTIGRHTALEVDSGADADKDFRRRNTVIGTIGIPSRTQFNEFPWYQTNITSDYTKPD